MQIKKDGWLELDPALDLTEKQRKAWETYKAAYAKVKQLRLAFESTMIESAPRGTEPVFGYLWGKLGIKYAPAGSGRRRVSTSSVTVKPQTLAAWLAERNQ